MPLSDLLAALRWWAALTALGLVALPLIYTVLRPLPDRGYAFVKPAGLLLVGYVFWLAGSLGLGANNGGGILLALLIVGGVSLLAYRRRAADDMPLGAWLRANRRTVIVSELLFAGIFVLWVWVRAQNPAISATEKPMEFAFLSGVGRSPTFPPLDPWLSGYAISYYYFGYVMTSLMAQLAFVTEAVAFNLAIAWLVAGTALGAYGVVYNIIAGGRIRNYEVRSRNQEHDVDGDSELVAHRSSLVPRAVLWGLVAAVAVSIAGNLLIGLEMLHGNGVGSDGLWQWLDVRDLDGPAIAGDTPRYQTSEWWWWRTSRVIHEYHLSGRAEEGLEPIVEVPAFSFILGDLHPHVLALPFAFLSLAVALAWWMRIRIYESGIRNQEEWADEDRDWNGQLKGAIGEVGWPLWLFTVVVLGGLSFLNTWDVLIHLFVVLGAYFLAHWVRGSRGVVERAVLMALLLVIPAALLYLPFYLGFRSQAGPPFLLPMLMRPTRLAHYLIIFGLPLTAITVFLVTLVARQRFRHWRAGLGAAAAVLGGLLLLMLLLLWIIASIDPGGGTVSNLAQEMGLSLAPRPDGLVAPGWGLLAMAAVLPAWVGARLASPWLALFLAGLLALVVMILRQWRHEAQSVRAVKGGDPQMGPMETTLDNLPNLRIDSAGESHGLLEHPTLPFVLLLILTGLLLTLGPEFVYLRDNFGVRLNTTFKFYYQAWALFGVAAVFALDYLLTMARGAGQRAVARLATAAYLALLAVALLFPIYAVGSRAVEYRGPARDAGGQPLERQPATLDGLAYLRRYNPSEYEALQWLRTNAVVPGQPPPVVLEAVGGQYSGFGRVSAFTGLPTLVGWPGHEWQWRGSDHPEPGRRESIVEQIYTALDLGVVGFLLDEFDVAYIVVGDLEAQAYGVAGLEKFRDGLDVAFANERVTIYRWQAAGTP